MGGGSYVEAIGYEHVLPGVRPRIRMRHPQGEVHGVADERSPEIDPRVLEAARRGDQAAFAQFVRHYDYRMRAMAWRVLRDRDLMDDALQDSYLKIFRSLPGFRGDSLVSTWMCRIVYTTCLDALRRNRKFVLLPSDELPEDAAAAPDVADEISRRAELEAALATLSYEHRVAVFLVDQEGFDYKSAGEVLGVPAGTVGSRLSFARAQLRRALARGAALEEEAEAQTASSETCRDETQRHGR